MIWTASSSQFSRSPGELSELDSQPLVLGLEPGAADPEDRAPVADVIEGGDHLRHRRRVAERVRTDHQPDRGALGGLGPGCQGHVGLEDRSVVVADDRVEVIPGPQGVEAEAVGPDARLAQVGPGRVLVPAVRAELHASVMADHLLDAHADDHPFLSRVPLRLAVVASRQVLNVGQAPARRSRRARPCRAWRPTSARPRRGG